MDRRGHEDPHHRNLTIMREPLIEQEAIGSGVSSTAGSGLFRVAGSRPPGDIGRQWTLVS
jgi:hypothetical protein